MAHSTDTRALQPNAVLERMHRDAREIFQVGLQAADPRDATHRHCHLQGNHLVIGDQTYDLAAIERLFIVGAGKAAAAMAQSMGYHTTVQRAAAAGLDIRWHLDNNDAYLLFQKLGDLLITGPTRTNVMDLRVVLARQGQ